MVTCLSVSKNFISNLVDFWMVLGSYAPLNVSVHLQTLRKCSTHELKRSSKFQPDLITLTVVLVDFSSRYQKNLLIAIKGQRREEEEEAEPKTRP